MLTLKLSSQSYGGALSSNTTVCERSNNGLLFVTGQIGTIQRWEFSQNANGPWAPIIFIGSVYNYINLNQSTYFRVVVQLTGYSVAYSNTVLVTCDLPSIAGTITTATLQCINLPVTSMLSGNTGSVLSWQSSTNNWITTNTITTSNTLIATLPSLTSTTQIRAYVQNGVCPADYSNTLTVNAASPSNGGSIAGTQSVCATFNASTLTLSNYTGSIQQWESALSFGGPYNIIASSANTNTISYSNLTQNSWYRVLVQNANCPSANSATFSVHVDQPSNGGSISGTQNVCAVTNSGTLQLLANTGLVTYWESSLNNGTNWSVINNTNVVQTFSNIPGNTIYRAFVQNGLCSPSVSFIFTVNVNPVPSVTFNCSNSCKLSSSNFINLTAGTNTYAWDFGDLGSSGNYNASHTYSTDGIFNVKLSATTSQGCTDSLKKTLTVYPLPITLLLSPDTSCYGTSLLMYNASSISSGSISNFKFIFNDGSPTSSLSPTLHFFPGDGSYSIYLIITSNFGCKDSALKQITIYPKPNTNFSTSNVCKGSPAFFNNTSTISNGNLHHSWNFGNGTGSSSNSPSYAYPMASTYTVSLISSSSHNCTDTLFKTITVNEKPDLSYTTNNVCFGAPVFFNSTINPSSLSSTATLNYGDGTSSASINGLHMYPSGGLFISTLTAVTDSGCITSIIKNITIYPKPIANFNFNNTCAADSVKFNNTSIISAGNMTYFWNLSNGISLKNSPTSLYTLPGNYYITLIVTSNFNCTDTLEKPITIFDAPKSDFNFSNACNGFPITFTNLTTVNTGIISNYQWDFGNNSTSSALNPSQEYLNMGTYTVTLMSASSNGCKNTIKKSVNVYEGPIAKFNMQSQCLNTAMTFTNQSILSAGTYSSSWRFGDTTISDQNSPSHLYSKSGSKTAWLKVTSSNLCVDSTSVQVNVFSNPKISAGRDTLLDKGLGVTLNANGALDYNWFPTTGLTNPVIKNPYASPDSTTIYYVEGTDINGCKGMDTITVKINNDLMIVPYNILTPDGNNKNDTWLVKNIQFYKENQVIIFDQWNQKVFEAENYHNEWDGKNQGGEILPDATYYYILTSAKSPKKYSGFITLIRNK